MAHEPIQGDRDEVVFEDYKPAYSLQQAIAEAERCLYCYDAPCIRACPTTIDIPTFIRKIATGNVKGSARTIFDSNILGMSCARVCPVEVLCVGDCVYNHMGVPPIQIGKLQRFSTDWAYQKGMRFFEAGEDTGKKVALIGGGPASLCTGGPGGASEGVTPSLVFALALRPDLGASGSTVSSSRVSASACVPDRSFGMRARHRPRAGDWRTPDCTPFEARCTSRDQGGFPRTSRPRDGSAFAPRMYTGSRPRGCVA